MGEDKAHALSVFTLQYRVNGTLDGVTPAPPFEEGVYTGENMLDFEVEDLGLIDLTLGRDVGQIADRIARWLYILSPNANTVADAVEIAFDGSAANIALAIPVGAVGAYSQQCILVPQSAQLRLRGFIGAPPRPTLVRIEVWRPSDIATLAEMNRYCCCSFENLPPVFFDCERTVLSIDPNQIDTALSPQVVPATITGTNFHAGDQVVLMSQVDPTVTLVVANVVVVNETTITLDIVLDGTEIGGDYDVIVGPEGFPDCAGLLEAGLELVAE